MRLALGELYAGRNPEPGMVPHTSEVLTMSFEGTVHGEDMIRKGLFSCREDLPRANLTRS